MQIYCPQLGLLKVVFAITPMTYLHSFQERGNQHLLYLEWNLKAIFDFVLQAHQRVVSTLWYSLESEEGSALAQCSIYKKGMIWHYTKSFSSQLLGYTSKACKRFSFWLRSPWSNDLWNYFCSTSSSSVLNFKMLEILLQIKEFFDSVTIPIISEHSSFYCNIWTTVMFDNMIENHKVSILYAE